MSINNLIAYFIIYSFVGWILESVYKTILSKKPINSGFLYGPFCPIYGFGVIIMLLFLKDFKNNIALLFLASFIILSAWEYIVGFLLEKIFKTKYWDYSDYKFNIRGRVCLKNSLFWGILGLVFTIVVQPPVQEIIESMPVNLLMYINIILLSVVLVDVIVTIIKVHHINLSLKTLAEISKNIKQELEKIKQYANKAKESEKLQHIIDELKQKQENMKLKLEKQTARLRKAFPTMKSEKISEFLSQKIESFRKNK